ncbi:MAG: hypothetical protein Q9210_000041 [Variospora velana]
MTNFISWAFPCFSINSSNSTAKDTQRTENPSSGSNRRELHPLPSIVPYRASMARSMYYLGDPPIPKHTNQIDGVAHPPKQGIVAADPVLKSFQRPDIPDGTTKSRGKQARPGLAVCIPPSRYTTPPIEKFHLSPDSTENQQALERTSRQGRSGHSQGVGPPRRMFFPSPVTPITKSAFSTTSTVMSDTPARGGRRSNDSRKLRKVNLGDELALFSITSSAGDVSAVGTQLSARATPALQPSELESSIHDFAHEKHRDGRRFLPPTAEGS